jgi:hypothetical protein
MVSSGPADAVQKNLAFDGVALAARAPTGSS